MSRKRERSTFSNQPHGPKRKNPRITHMREKEERGEPKSRGSSLVIVCCLPSDCTIMELKSRFESFGSIARARIDSDCGTAQITYRLRDSAEAAIANSKDPFGISIRNKKIQVSWADDPLPRWKVGVGLSSHKDRQSKLLRPETPLSRHGKLANRLGAVNRESNSSFKDREVVAYDDLL
ncbi:hypothetical protein AMTRI_Chr03g147000 [Amborella trichopoda]|uniref:RRM domain-containing protein n=1 Tax=Amborella trichopoda TaxID=13333 RepID=W1P033_AMBTC|nr:uncharacterized protein At1g27050 [Amborella trichopoda]ERN01288.1 hypothetical protein AMTR_s00002p00251920 [Amborella trichopoda]|eukprot:XP_006838719.1 uncharacterized protein At1g27050 [Amborella trichopoda]